MSTKPSCKSGFTLIELMIVVVLLGILAAIVLSMVQNYSRETRETALRCELRNLRSQIINYELNHNGNPPAADQLRDLMLNRTTSDGQIDGQGTLGPYLLTFPSNPYNGRIDVKAVAIGGDLVADDSSGWLYGVDGSNFTIAANSSGLDRVGTPLIRY